MKFQVTPSIIESFNESMKLGSNTIALSGSLVDNDRNKCLKLGADSTYTLCVAGDPIEATLAAVEAAPIDGYSFGTIRKGGKMSVICDGLEATPGTGTIAVGDFVVCGTVVPAGTALGTGVGPQVTKATYQPGTAIVSTVAGADTAAAVKTMLDLELVKLASQQANTLFAWRVVALGVAGAVGDTAVIEAVNFQK